MSSIYLGKQIVGSIKEKRRNRGKWKWETPDTNQINCILEPLGSGYFLVHGKYKHDRTEETVYSISSTSLELIRHNKGIHLWKHLFFINRCKPSHYSYDTAKRKGWWVKIKSTILDDALGTRYYQGVVEDCIALGIVERKERKIFFHDGEYKSTCYSYRIASKHRSKAVTVVYRNPRVAKKINAMIEAQISAAIGGDLNRQWVHDTLMNHVSIDAEKAMQNFEANKPKDASENLIRCFNEGIENFILGNFYFKRDFNTGRLYHSGSNLSRLARPFILIDGEETAEIDTGCSQPSYATTLYPGDCAERRKYIGLISDNIYATLEELACMEYESYKKLKGKFFEEVFYCKNGNVWEKPLWNVYKEILPLHAALITKEKLDDYKQFSNLMQTREADLMVGKVVQRLREQFIKAITVHDSIVVKRSDAKVSLEIMKEELFRFLGFNPRVDCSCDF